jgi:hypothetical protein
MRSGWLPNSLLSSMRSCVPPRLTRATWRTVSWFSWKGTLVGSKKSPCHSGSGAAIQLLVQKLSATAGVWMLDRAMAPAAIRFRVFMGELRAVLKEGVHCLACNDR